MNMDLLRRFVVAYEKRFDEISRDEIYKWQAVQWFTRHWNIEAANFAVMLEESLRRTSNLLESGYYYPRRMILRNAEREPEAVREAFRGLFDEEDDLIARITSFQTTLKGLTERGFPGKKSFQDDRAVLVYLVMRYPDTYYLYKPTMFAEFVRKLGYDYRFKWQKSINIIPYLNLCERIREEIVQYDSLLKRHFERIGTNEYADEAFHLLTQDLIYAVTKYLTLDEEPDKTPRPHLTLTSVTVEPLPKTPVLKGSFADHVTRQQRRTRVGNLGEELINQIEKHKHGEKVIHTSRVEGDGLGYDILSVGDDGGPIFIEVKTTKGGPTTPFYVTATELEQSRRVGDRYYLYRLYNFDEGNWSADYYILQGDLSRFCINPIQFEVIVNLGESG